MKFLDEQDVPRKRSDLVLVSIQIRSIKFWFISDFFYTFIIKNPTLSRPIRQHKIFVDKIKRKKLQPVQIQIVSQNNIKFQ